MSDFRSVLEHFIYRSGFSLGQLSRLTAVPKRTLANWVAGRVKRPRHFEDLLKVAAALHLAPHEASRLLQSAQHPDLNELLQQPASSHEPDLLAPWREAWRQTFAQAPFQVAPDLPFFVGRSQELEHLQAALLDDKEGIICGLLGMGGVGKTTLAIRTAYQLRGYFPDGVLWARLNSSDVMSILQSFANAYRRDVNDQTDLDSRSRTVRDIMVNKRALIVLDDAQKSQQIKPLLPSTGACRVLITSRAQNLAIPGMQRFHLQPFSATAQESLQLFSHVMGTDQAQQNKAHLTEIVEILGHLPLAINIVAHRLAYEPNWQVADFQQRLKREQGKLRELKFEDQSVRLSFELSYQALPPSLQQFFTALGLFNGESIRVAALAYMMNLTPEETHDNLRQLYTYSLVEQGENGRYRLHSLLHEYAQSRLENPEWQERMIHYFVRFVIEHQHDYDQIGAEFSHIVAALRLAYDNQAAALFVSGIKAFGHYLTNQGLYALAKELLEQAREQIRPSAPSNELGCILFHLGEIARKEGDFQQAEVHFLHGVESARLHDDPQNECDLLYGLGRVAIHQGHFGQAESYLRDALSIARASNFDHTASGILMSLGAVAGRQGNKEQAEAYFSEGLLLARRSGDDERVAKILGNLGALVRQRKAFSLSKTYFQESLALSRKIGNDDLLHPLLANLGECARIDKKYQEAEAYLQEGLAIAHKLGRRLRSVEFLRNLGKLARDQGQYEQAAADFQEGLALARQIEYRWGILTVLNEWGMLDQKELALEQARLKYMEAFNLAKEIGARDQAGIILYNLSHLSASQGNYTTAYSQGQQSLSILTAIRHSQQTQVTEWLSMLEQQESTPTIDKGTQ